MLEILKNVALSIAVVGFGLGVLLPGLYNLYSITENFSGMFKNLLGVITYIALLIVLVLYFIISIYFIWIHNGFI